MASYYEPDLSGVNPDYLVESDFYTVFTANQRINFHTPIFLNSLVINITGTIIVPFLQTTDWTVAETDIDQTSMSQMMNYDPSFNATLIKSITIVSSHATPYKISCTYQKLYPVTEKISIGDGGAVELTPDLINDILQRLANVQIQLAQVPDVNSTGPTTPKLFPLDQNETNVNNIITETHTVNTFGGQNLIIPGCGSFFGDNVRLVLDTTNAVLVNGTDYILIGLDVAKTKATIVTAGVYNFILLTKPYAGNVDVTCHAYGGAVTFYDMTAVWETVNNINAYLGATQFLTPSLLGNNPVIQSLTTRISQMETLVRNLINSGQPTYGDVTGNGTASLQRIRSVDANLHWWSIATLYQVAGSAQVITADRMHFRMQLLNANLAADVFVAVNLALPNPFSIDAISIAQVLGYVPFTSYGTVPVAMPQFRIIYNTGTGTPSGITLQIGLELATLTETVSIQDLSGTESCWLLIPGVSSVLTPQDGMVTLPNTLYIWDPSFGGSQQFAHMMPNKTGYLAWGGALAVSAMTSSAPNVLTPLIDNSFIITDITKVRLEFTTTADATTTITVDVPMGVYSDATIVTGSAFVQNSPTDGTMILLRMKITKTSGVFAISITPDHIPGSVNLVLRHVLLLLN